MRIGSILLILLLVFLATRLFVGISSSPAAGSFADQIQALGAAVDILVLCCGGMVFLFTLETRIRRQHALKAIHELRSLAHVVDMHQLAKDPDHLSPTVDSPDTSTNAMSSSSLFRYLDYSSDLLAIISKVAALYVQRLPDPVVLGAVDEIESLTSDLSRKIWQKMMILDRRG